MSLRIKIPKGGAQATDTSRIAKPKRRIDSEDDDTEPTSGRSVEPESKRPRVRRSSTSQGLSRRSARVEDDEVDVDVTGTLDATDAHVNIEDEDVNVDEEDDDDDPDDEDDISFLPPPVDAPSASNSASPPPSASRPRRTVQLTERAMYMQEKKRQGQKRRRQPVWSDDEDEEESYAPARDDEDEPEPESKPRRGGSVSKGRNGKLLLGKGTKGKGKKEDDRPILMKDERKLPPVLAETAGAGSSVKRGRIKDEDVSLSPAPRKVESESATPVKTEDPTPPPPKRPKLPPIKKNKPGGSAGPSTPAPGKLLAPSKPAPALAQPDPSLARPSASQLRKPPDARTADFDLRDPNAYSALFSKKSTTNTPNGGLSSKERVEERKKELNRMREEARVKRAEEAKQSFDLQANQEKIRRFEEKLRERKSSAVYPNILGAAFAAAHERTKRAAEEPKDR